MLTVSTENGHFAGINWLHKTTDCKKRDFTQRLTTPLATKADTPTVDGATSHKTGD